MTRTCSRCGLQHYARGFCRKHYLEAIRSGDIVVGGRGRPPKRPMTPDVQHDVAHALIAGRSLSEISRDLGVSRYQARNVRTALERLNT